MRNRAYSVVSPELLAPKMTTRARSPLFAESQRLDGTGGFHHKTHSLGDYEEPISCWGLASGGQGLSDRTGRFHGGQTRMRLALAIRSILDNNNN
ncbi:hypothetical protein BDW60DRAFT_107115 [Aspergillus nidulans var. acristatus]